MGRLIPSAECLNRPKGLLPGKREFSSTRPLDFTAISPLPGSTENGLQTPAGILALLYVPAAGLRLGLWHIASPGLSSLLGNPEDFGFSSLHNHELVPTNKIIYIL